MRVNSLNQSTAENLIDLAHLSPMCVVDVLRNRYEWDLIYTAVGSMLIAVNPYRDIQHSFSAESANIYLSSSLSQLDVMAPHIFAVAARAWLGLQGIN
jgi:myosin heavy subunit